MIHYNSVTSTLASSSSSWPLALMMKSMDTVGMNAKLHATPGAVEWRSTTEILSGMRSSSILQVSVFCFVCLFCLGATVAGGGELWVKLAFLFASL